MKFVHLAPRSKIGRIKRNGIRLGGGRRGRGVYAVPLFKVKRQDYPYEDESPEFESEPLPTTDIWRPLFREPRRRGNRPIAVVFTLPDILWPVDLFLRVTPDMARTFVAVAQRCQSQGYRIPEGALRQIEEAFSFGVAYDEIELQVHNASALGFLLNQWLEANPTVWVGCDDPLETVIRAPVPASAVQKLVPLSQRNRKAKVRRNRELRRSLEEDVEQAD